MATTIERGKVRGTQRTLVREAASAYLDVAASSARLGPVVLADIFLAGTWAVGATLLASVCGTLLLAPLGLDSAGWGSAVDGLIWLVAFAIPIACHRYRERLESARKSCKAGAQ